MQCTVNQFETFSTDFLTLYNVCSVPCWVLSTAGVFSTMGGYHEYCGGYHEYHGDIMSTIGDILSTLGDVQYHGGYVEYCGGCSVPWGIC